VPPAAGTNVAGSRAIDHPWQMDVMTESLADGDYLVKLQSRTLEVNIRASQDELAGLVRSETLIGTSAARSWPADRPAVRSSGVPTATWPRS
jgi:hypothetical protein